MEERFGFYLAIWAVLSFRKASKMLFGALLWRIAKWAIR